MLLTFTPNPCIERTLAIPDFRLGRVHRVGSGEITVSAGGKGLNAARVAANFGAATAALALVGHDERAFFEAQLEGDAIVSLLVESPVPTRTCVNVVHNNGITEILESGVTPDTKYGTHLLAIWCEQLRTCRLALIGGSYPSSHDPAWNAHAGLLCHLARAANVPIIYDGKGAAFRRAVFSKTPPWAIKPNLAEAEELLGRELQTAPAQRHAIKELMKRGVEVVLLTLGAKGCYLGWRGNIEWFASPAVETVSAVGSGDALLGAFAAKWLETADVVEATRWGVAAGAANAARLTAARVGPTDCEPLLPHVTRQTLEIALMS